MRTFLEQMHPAKERLGFGVREVKERLMGLHLNEIFHLMLQKFKKNK